MRRLQFYLRDEQKRKIDALARRRGVPSARVLRELLDQALAGDPIPFGEDPLDEIVGAGRGAGGAVSEHVDELLYGLKRRGRPR